MRAHDDVWMSPVSRCAVLAEVVWAGHKDEWRHVFGGSGGQVRWSHHVFWGSSKPSWEAPVVEHEINGTLMAEPCHEGQRQQSLGSSGGLGTMSCETRANIVREAPVAAEVFARMLTTLDGLAWRDGGQWECRRWQQGAYTPGSRVAWIYSTEPGHRESIYFGWAGLLHCLCGNSLHGVLLCRPPVGRQCANHHGQLVGEQEYCVTPWLSFKFFFL